MTYTGILILVGVTEKISYSPNKMITIIHKVYSALIS